MSRRITAAIVGMVVGTMLLAGVGTLIAVRVAGKAREIQVIEDRAEGIADLVPNLDRARTGTSETATAVAEAQAKIVQVLGLSGVSQLRISAQGRLVGAPPAWIPARDLDVAALERGETLSGTRANRIWAAAARGNPNGSFTVAVVTDTREATVGPALRWLALSSAVTLLVGAGVSIVLGRRLGRPVREAVVVTGRIAGGDLSARLPERHGAVTNDELGDLARSVNDMAEQLDRARSLEHQFLMSVSHDLRTPLTSIRGYAEAIADGIADPVASSAVILAESQRLERLVADLLDLAKLDAKQFGFRPVTTVLGPIVDDAVARIAPDAHAASLAVRVANQSTARVHVDPDRLAQVVGNLTSNSLKFARTAVWIRTRDVGGLDGRPGVGIDVSDDGPGIAAEDLPHVFERLYQARHDVPAREAGSGLGLAIVKELVEGMGGRVSVTSVPGSGSTFSVWFPAA